MTITFLPRYFLGSPILKQHCAATSCRGNLLSIAIFHYMLHIDAQRDNDGRRYLSSFPVVVRCTSEETEICVSGFVVGVRRVIGRTTTINSDTACSQLLGRSSVGSREASESRLGIAFRRVQFIDIFETRVD